MSIDLKAEEEARAIKTIETMEKDFDNYHFCSLCLGDEDWHYENEIDNEIDDEG